MRSGECDGQGKSDPLDKILSGNISHTAWTRGFCEVLPRPAGTTDDPFVPAIFEDGEQNKFSTF